MGGRHGPGAAGAHVHRRLRDAGERLPQAARRRPGVPAGVGRARAPGTLLDDRRPSPGGDPGRRRQLVETGAGGATRRLDASTRSAPSRTRLTGSGWRRRPRRSPSGAAPWGSSPTTWCAPSSAAGPAARRPRHPGPDRPHHRPGGGVRPHAPPLTIVAPCPLEEDDDDPEAAYWRTVATSRSCAPACPARSRARRPPREEDPMLGPVTSNLSREASRPGWSEPRIHLRGRRVPGRALAALLRAKGLARFAVYRALRRSTRRPYMYYLSPRGPRRLVAGDPGAGRGRPVEIRPIAGTRPRGGRGRGRAPRAGAAGRPEGAGRARDAGGSGPQRRGPGRRVRHACTSPS